MDALKAFEPLFDDLWIRLESAGAEDIAISMSLDPRPGHSGIKAVVEFTADSPPVKG